MITVPLFFAADENYLPFLAVAIKSIKNNASKSCRYNVHILHSGIPEKSAARILEESDERFYIEFNDVSEKLDSIAEKLQLRDYYTGTTYYRIFIAEMFPEYDKAIYLDSDTVILGDVSELYIQELGNNLVGAVTDETVSDVSAFRLYVKEALGIEPNKYFNAGVLLMNLKKFRDENFYGKFNSLLGKYRFSVAQDQDYLNVLCKNNVYYVSRLWNKMPIQNNSLAIPKLVHYNLTRKPWHYPNVLYREYFWEYAQKTSFHDEILSVLDNFTEEQKLADAECEKRLVALALSEAKNPLNYYNKYVRFAVTPTEDCINGTLARAL